MIEVIAEIGINHNGDMDLAKRMIWLSKVAGADVAKFQIYDPVRVLDPDHPALQGYWDAILKTELTKKQVVMLKKECDKHEIEFLASVFRPEVVGWTEEIGMRRYKIASRSVYDDELAKAIAATRKPVIFSCGHCVYNKAPAISLLRQYVFDFKISRLYCISKYPTLLTELYLSHNIFKDDFDGFSDHTIGTTASIVAMSLGAKIIEKHVTVDRKMHGPDHKCSITFQELTHLCNVRDEINEILY